jgi:hypothetical protein
LAESVRLDSEAGIDAGNLQLPQHCWGSLAGPTVAVIFGNRPPFASC